MGSVLGFEQRLNSFLASRKGQNSIAFLFLLFFFIFNAFSVQGKDRTYDEPRHYQYGMNILNGNSARFDDSKMPISAWNALPAKIVDKFHFPDGLLKAYLQKLITARLMTTLFSMAVAFVVFHWSRQLYGFVPALFSIGLYIFDPNIIAHSQLVTTDVYATGMILFSAYWLWKFANSRRWRDGIWLAVMLGMAQLAKYTAISLYPLFALTLLVYDWPAIRTAFEISGWRAVGRVVSQYLKYAVVVIVISLVIINVGFLFSRTFTHIRDYQFRSDLFKSFQSKVTFIVPVPYPYLEGLDWIIQREQTNTGFGRVYLLGETRFGQGFPGYYFVASLLKVPIATQIVLLVAFAVYSFDREGRKYFFCNE